MAKTEITIRPFDVSHRQWAAKLLKQEWGSIEVVSRGRLHQVLELPGFVAIEDSSSLALGLTTYRYAEEECELVTINSLRPGEGIGSALLQAVKRRAQELGCRRLWLITTNDNVEALRFYQVRGFLLADLHRNALQVSRQLKPQIPRLGKNDIPLRDEIELEIKLHRD